MQMAGVGGGGGGMNQFKTQKMLRKTVIRVKSDKTEFILTE